MKRTKGRFIPGKFKLRVRRARAGRGVFTLEPVKKGACVLEYKGKRLTPAQDDKTDSNYLFFISKNKTIDGWVPRNPAKFVNHSCRPNCEIEFHKKRVYLMAKRAIKAGEELSYDYDTDYFEAYIEPRGCKCLKCSPL